MITQRELKKYILTDSATSPNICHWGIRAVPKGKGLSLSLSTPSIPKINLENKPRCLPSEYTNVLTRITTDIVRACLPAGRDLPRILLGVLVFFLFCLVGVGQAQEGKEKFETTTAAKGVQGEISGIGKNFIAIVYEKDLEKGIEYEILLPIEKDIRLTHKRSLDQLSVGDIVSVQYDEVTEEHKEGLKQKRKAKIISFVKPAEKKPEAVELETAVLDSGAPGEERLPMKGIKGQ